MGIFDIFKRKQEPVKPKVKTWIGTIEAEWVSLADKEFVYYNLFIEDGVRVVEISGLNGFKHPLYLTRIYPWKSGGSEELIVDHLKTFDATYWSAYKNKTNPDVLPEIAPIEPTTSVKKKRWKL